VCVTENVTPCDSACDSVCVAIGVRIPRAPDDIALTTDITTLPEGVTIDQCFTVFVSHRWTRAGIQAVDFDGRPEPDSKHHDKHKLIVSGITNLWETCAKDLKYCYLWIDYSCLNQSVYPGSNINGFAPVNASVLTYVNFL
jgi:hypothetical protein